MFDLGRTWLAAVARSPNALAVVDDERRLTYRRWDELIRRVAAGLSANGIARGDHFVVILQNRLEFATLHWAAQLIGAVITPLNWRALSDEVDFVLTDADAKAVVFESVSAEAVAGSARAATLTRIGVGQVPGASFDFEALSAHQPIEPQPGARVSDPSVMLYTSGTTGRGKGVPRSHHAERSAAIAHVAQNLYRSGESTLGVMPLYHTMGVRSLLAMAVVNGCFVCLPRFDVPNALRLIERERVTTLYLVPTLYHDLIHHEAFSPSAVATVRKLGYAGAPMTDGLLGEVQRIFDPALFVNHYGSSEIYTFTVEQDAVGKPGSAGRAGLNQEIRVIALGASDPSRHALVGDEGQIIARLDGDESFTGYWRRPDADTKALRSGWYFTGDTGYFDEDGDLFVTGRVDDMIISGGENISPVEIESVLSLHEGVREVAVVGAADERWGQVVTAFITGSPGLDSAALDAHCRGSALADFKRPRNYIFVTEIPKSPVGKILRRLLLAGAYEIDKRDSE